MAKKVLFVCTSCDAYPNGDATGSWYEEIAAPYYVLKDGGVEVTMASIKGGKVPIDAGSLGEGFKTADVDRFIADAAAVASLEDSVALSEAVKSEYDGIYIPGGHGTCFDLPGNADLAALLVKYVEAKKAVASVCHGPTAFIDVKLSNREYLVSGKKVTGFTNSEEKAVGKDGVVPFSLEDKLKEQGGKYSSVPDWAEGFAIDGKVITGQNPASSKKVGQLMLMAL